MYVCVFVFAMILIVATFDLPVKPVKRDSA